MTYNVFGGMLNLSQSINHMHIYKYLHYVSETPDHFKLALTTFFGQSLLYTLYLDTDCICIYLSNYSYRLTITKHFHRRRGKLCALNIYGRIEYVTDFDKSRDLGEYDAVAVCFAK